MTAPTRPETTAGWLARAAETRPRTDKQSGFGRDKGLHALDGYTQLKTTWFDLSAE